MGGTRPHLPRSAGRKLRSRLPRCLGGSRGACVGLGSKRSEAALDVLRDRLRLAVAKRAQHIRGARDSVQAVIREQAVEAVDGVTSRRSGWWREIMSTNAARGVSLASTGTPAAL